MKFPIAWHEDGLANMKISLDSELKELELRRARIELTKRRIDVVASQLMLAKKRGLVEYDPERLGVKRGAP